MDGVFSFLKKIKNKNRNKTFFMWLDLKKECASQMAFPIIIFFLISSVPYNKLKYHKVQYVVKVLMTIYLRFFSANPGPAH